MWSFLVVQDGLIYVVDLRDGLYVLKDEGALWPAVRAAGSLEGNSNVGQVPAAEARVARTKGRRPTP